ncbi:MAG: RNA polymerase sigma factor [Phycisphaerales bacterium]
MSSPRADNTRTDEPGAPAPATGAPSVGAARGTADPRSDEEIIRDLNAAAAAERAGRSAASTTGSAGGPSPAARHFEALYERHRAWVFALALRFTTRHEEALDVTQEVFIYLLGKFPGFVLTSKLTTFLYPAVKHIALARRRRKTPRAMSDDVLDIVVIHPAPPERPDLEGLAGVLRGLSEVHREAVLMRFVDGMSMEEMSAALGVPVGTVKSRLHNAVAALRADPRVAAYFGQDD